MGVEIGQTVGDYEVIGTLGAGGMGRVFKVRNVISDRVDAMKILLPDLGGSSELAERFLNEIKVLARLRHSNIAALHTALRIDNQLLMIMELVDGANLEERLSAGPLAIGEAVSCICQVLEALSYAHARSVVHRDIKPANIAISSQDVVKLLDFGVARGPSDRHLTHTGMVLGSLFYMSPEQVTGEPADARSDLYSVGLTLYRAITGKRPIDGESEYAVMRAQTSSMPDPPKKWRHEIPESLSSAIMRSISKAPGARFQTAEEFRLALQAFHSLPIVTQTVKPPVEDMTRTILRALEPPPAPASEPPTSLPSGTIFHGTALAALEKNFAHWVGPIAGPLVRKYSRTAADIDELCRALAEQIPDEASRRAFLKSCLLEAAPVSTHSSAVAATVGWDPAILERARRDLANYLGPLAKIMVDRSAKKARTTDELYMVLSDHITSPDDRRKFLASRGI